MNTEIIDAGRDMSGGYMVDVSRGENVDRVSSEWFARPDDERFLSLDDLFASVKGRAERSRTRTVESAAIRVEANRDNPEKLGLVLPGADEPIAPTHWSFGQLSSLVGAPAAYLRQLPAPLAGINLQYGMTNHRAEQIKTMEVADGRTELRAVTGPDYGRIYDHELVSAVQRIAGNGTGDTRWKVPGVGQHLGFQKASNSLRRLLTKQDIKPEQCAQFDLVSYGPIFSEIGKTAEQDHGEQMELHKPVRDRMAALERDLRNALADAGYSVLNVVRSKAQSDPENWSAVLAAFSENFPKLTTGRADG